jgi:hypothetical protein
MNEKYVREKLDLATADLIGDTEPVRQLVWELFHEWAEANAELLSIEAACKSASEFAPDNEVVECRKWAIDTLRALDRGEKFPPPE